MPGLYHQLRDILSILSPKTSWNPSTSLISPSLVKSGYHYLSCGLLIGPTVPNFVMPHSILHSSNDQGDLFPPYSTTFPLLSLFFSFSFFVPFSFLLKIFLHSSYSGFLGGLLRSSAQTHWYLLLFVSSTNSFLCGSLSSSRQAWRSRCCLHVPIPSALGRCWVIEYTASEQTDLA